MNSIRIGNNTRFTAICPELIRIEHSGEGLFEDTPTLFAQRDEPQEFELTTSHEDGLFRLSTMKLTLEYTGEGAPPDANNLVIRLNDSGEEWRPGTEDDKNLGGPLQTLDGCNGPLPLEDGLLSKSGWYLLDDSRSHILVDGWVAERPLKHSYRDWYFFGYGRDYRAALRALGAVSGRVPLPRKHVFGSWYCRWWPYTSDDYRKIVAEYREHDFPLDIMVMDMDWHRKDGTTGFGWCNRGAMGWTGWSWNRKLLPDIEALLQELRNDQVYVTLNAHPHDGIRTDEDMYDAFMRDLGHDPAEGKSLPFLAGDRRYMEAYFKHAHEPHEKMGVDFWWVDWQQDSLMPYVYHISYLRHLPWLNHTYFLNSQKLGRRGLGFSRWAGWGDHRYPIHFSGDTAAKWDVLEFEIPFTVASGNSGCFFWAHDTGGFASKERDPELYTRWVQFCTFSASLRLHSCGEHLDRRPWLWGEPYTSVMRQAFHLRAQLLPYVYTAAWQCHDLMVPLLRGMYLDYPHADEAYEFKNQYLFGDHLLVAPVVKPGEGQDHAVTQKVWIPAGEWQHWFTQEVTQGPAVIETTATLDQIPVWIRAGALIPMQPYSERMSSTPHEILQLRCVPVPSESPPVTSYLYEDDGQSDQYIEGACARTVLSQQHSGNVHTIQIGATEGSFDGQHEARAVELHLFGYPKLSIAELDGTQYEVTTTSACQVVKLPQSSIRQAVTIQLS